jgi:uncharacterized integral membrane protein (TIGR00698 family)
MSLTTSASVPVRAPTRPVRWPGLVLALAGGLAGWWVHTHVSQISAPVVAVVLGVLVGNSALASHTAAGLRVAGRRFIRTGVVLLGLRISVGEVFDLGPALLAVVVLVVAITFVGTRHLGRRMGLSPGFSLLVATGWSICGASAIAAVEPLAGAEDEEVAYAVAMVTCADRSRSWRCHCVGGLDRCARRRLRGVDRSVGARRGPGGGDGVDAR